MGINELTSDLKAYEQRLASLGLAAMPPGEFQATIQRELQENLVPLLGSIAELLARDVLVPLEELGGAVDQLIDQSEDLLQPTTSAQIQAVLEMGIGLIGEMKPLLAKADDVTRARLAGAVTAFEASAAAAIQMVQSITLDDEADDDDGTDGADDKEGDDE